MSVLSIAPPFQVMALVAEEVVSPSGAWERVGFYLVTVIGVSSVVWFLQRGTEDQSRPEFRLLTWLLASLMLLVLFVLLVPVSTLGIKSNQVADFRSNTLAVLLTAFGAWVGAGVAYYFGRENLKDAAKSMLAMRNATPREQLFELTVANSNPRSITQTFGLNRSMADLEAALVDDADEWFLVIVKADDLSLVTVVHAELVWRFAVAKRNKDGTTDLRVSIEDALSAIASAKVGDPLYRLQKYTDIHVVANSGTSLGSINQQMVPQDSYLAVVVDDRHVPVSYVTSGDIRKALWEYGQ